VIDGKDPDDFDYSAFDHFPDSEDQLFPQPGADFDLSDDAAGTENDSVEPLVKRVQRIQERIRSIPLPKIRDYEFESGSGTPESPTNQLSPSPSPNQ
jgi:hypothetical protein